MNKKYRRKNMDIGVIFGKCLYPRIGSYTFVLLSSSEHDYSKPNISNVWGWVSVDHVNASTPSERWGTRTHPRRRGPRGWPPGRAGPAPGPGLMASAAFTPGRL